MFPDSLTTYTVVWKRIGSQVKELDHPVLAHFCNGFMLALEFVSPELLTQSFQISAQPDKWSQRSSFISKLYQSLKTLRKNNA